MQLDILKYHLYFSAVEKITLPEFSGSTFRGIFGHSLKTLSCINLNEECNKCDFNSDCIYTNIFETKPPKNDNPPFPGLNNIPHPFILRPGSGLKKELLPNDIFSLELHIFGEYCNWAHYFLKALQNAGEIGAGKGNKKFCLTKIVDGNSKKDIFENGQWISEPVIQKISILNGETPDSCQIQFVTPVRFVKQGRVVKELTPNILFKEAGRRFMTLAHYYGVVDSDYKFQNVLDGIKELHFKSDLKIKKISRYSNRKNKFINIDGLVGSITMTNIPPLNYSLLKAMESVHLGKSTALGLGHIKIWKS